MKKDQGFVLLSCGLVLTGVMTAQVMEVKPQIRNRMAAESKVTVVEVLAHFVTAVRLPEPVNSVAIGDPTLFQVEYNEHEPELVFIKALTSKPAESNLLVSTTRGRQISVLLVSAGEAPGRANVDFLVRFKPLSGFLVAPEVVPVFLVGESASLSTMPVATSFAARVPGLAASSTVGAASPPARAQSDRQPESLDQLLERQEQAPLPPLFGERIRRENKQGDRLRAGVSEVIDAGQQVIVLFSTVNTSRHAILLMPPQVQLGGTIKSGKLIKRDRWLTAEQLPVIDFRWSKRRIGSEERADGVVLFERPPYKQSNQTLFLQVAESGAVDRPALVPIGFGITTAREVADHGTRGNEQ
jgi:Flp pilus assembly secretin CpaC